MPACYFGVQIYICAKCGSLYVTNRRERSDNRVTNKFRAPIWRTTFEASAMKQQISGRLTPDFWDTYSQRLPGLPPLSATGKTPLAGRRTLVNLFRTASLSLHKIHERAK
jgi:hypothetical protein